MPERWLGWKRKLGKVPKPSKCRVGAGADIAAPDLWRNCVFYKTSSVIGHAAHAPRIDAAVRARTASYADDVGSCPFVSRDR